jgi:radical SAM superfamily enzyme YgiQ (UPF0313 family)
VAADEGLSTLVDVTLVDFLVDDDPDGSIQQILSHNPDAVGFSLYVWNLDAAANLAAQLRHVLPNLIIFAGGPQASADPHGSFASGPFDYIISGEGERPFLDLMGRLLSGETIEAVRGIITPEAPVPGRPPLEILDTIPSPYLNGIIDPANYDGILWQLSRGCSFSCDYCFDMKGAAGVRRFSLPRLESELKLFVQKQVSQVFVLDSTFNQHPAEAKAILRMIGRFARHIHFHFEVRSEFLDREMAQLFSKITCSLQIGLQSSNPQVLRQVHRHLDQADLVAKVGLLNEAGAIFGFDLIYGLPDDSYDGFAESIDFALALAPNHLDIFPLAILPGTKLAERAPELGLIYTAAPPYTVTATPTFPAAAMVQASKLAAASDIFYSRGKAVAWFNLVTHPLGIKGSTLLSGFIDWISCEEEPLKEEMYTDREIWQLQRAFITEAYLQAGIEHLLPAAMDHIDYNYYYAAVLMAPEPDLPTDRNLALADLGGLPFSLHPSSHLARFHYDVVDVLEAGALDLEEFTSCFTPTGSFAVIYPRAQEVFSESLTESYYELLSTLDGCRPAGDIAIDLGLDQEEVAEFLEFAAAEGIICFPPAE